ncbi:hypothetical protein QTA57_15580 [Fontisubflavum oceani]|uniref:hypothetical protein n=1 Tax=Fontisubflavum oceani TaxID=2978973 RepID=UPI0025B58E34|nr:hypothetical protein [Fontisubflavum oceani]WJY21179.1 hypothetical protein QTA57_15580 [Fontisubflavum oceani]
MAVEQEPDFLNSDTEEEGDAFMAWALLSDKIEQMPNWAQKYFEGLLEKIDEFDPHEDEEIALTRQLEVPVLRSRQRRKIGAKSKYDYASIFDWVNERQRKAGVSLDTALWDYIEETDFDLDAFETIKSAYHKVRRARLANIEQHRPHFTLSKTKPEGD